MKGFISYEGKPISGGGAHGLGKKPIEKIYAETIDFLSKFTNNNSPNSLQLIFYTSQDGSYKTWPILWKLVKKFGIPSYNKWDLPDVNQHYFTWKLRISSIEKGFEILKQYNDLPKNQYGPLTLSFYWHFHFIDPQTNEVFPKQELIPMIDARQRPSQIYLRLGQKSTLSAWFAFPFEQIGEKEGRYFKTLIDHLPFVPSEKFWRLWKVSPKGNWTPEAVNVLSLIADRERTSS